jgi:uncharacterized protein (PEP-CTERM system associated)
LGFSGTWLPSDRTKLVVSRQGHSYGDSHNFALEHRTLKTMWRLSDSQSVTATPSQVGIGSIGTVYDLFFAQFESIEPDPARRAVLVSSYLQATGINPTASVLSSFLTSAVSMQRRQDLSVALLGVRDTVTFLASRTEGFRVDTVSTGVDDLSNSSTVRQSGLSINYAHRLTPQTSLNMLFSMQNASSSATLSETVTRSVNLGLATTLGRRTTAAASARRVVFESVAAPYTETAITGTVSVQF